jgi:spore coat protein CotH
MAYLLDPVNYMTQKWVPADVEVSVDGTLHQLRSGFKLKGGGSARQLFKKSWNMKFNEYEDQTLLDISKLGFKGAASGFLLSNILATDLYRSAMVATQRGGFAGLRINGVWSGFYEMLEDAFTGQFVKSRFGTGNLEYIRSKYKAFLDYMGDDPQSYQDWSYTRYDVTEQHYELMRDKNPNVVPFASLASIAKLFNSSEISDAWQAEVLEQMDVEHLLRYWVVQGFSYDTDGYSGFGNNFGLIWKEGKSQTLITCIDFDDTFDEDTTSTISAQARGRSRLVSLSKTLEVASWCSRLCYAGRIFSAQVGPSLTARVQLMEMFLKKSVDTDMMARLSLGPEFNWAVEVERIQLWLLERVRQLTSESNLLTCLAECKSRPNK